MTVFVDAEKALEWLRVAAHNLTGAAGALKQASQHGFPLTGFHADLVGGIAQVVESLIGVIEEEK